MHDPGGLIHCVPNRNLWYLSLYTDIIVGQPSLKTVPDRRDSFSLHVSLKGPCQSCVCLNLPVWYKSVHIFLVNYDPACKFVCESWAYVQLVQWALCISRTWASMKNSLWIFGLTSRVCWQFLLWVLSLPTDLLIALVHAFDLPKSLKTAKSLPMTLEPVYKSSYKYLKLSICLAMLSRLPACHDSWAYLQVSFWLVRLPESLPTTLDSRAFKSLHGSRAAYKSLLDYRACM